ncbi:lycopene cyclase domain-containing protein [Namhaeicola litoreus]|uniref:Lycopene cyclase domain-containing protein n=1 Tax=Namhaeicola litoreus TaxID=1052145 RepID=A0ABW3Y143_9FLAO
MSLYFWINLLSISVPFLVTFHPRIKLHHYWKSLFSAIAVSMIPFIIWDIYFTKQQYWGFNPDYLSQIYILGLPVEEWLFFICIPYACVFTHESILAFNRNISLNEKTTKLITFGLLFFFMVMLILHYDKAYTAVDMIFGIIILSIVYITNLKLLSSYYITFLVMLIPFFIVNGVLTGTGINEEVVWYNNDENLGIRILTIPVEDIAYAFSLLLLNLLLFKKFKQYDV